MKKMLIQFEKNNVINKKIIVSLIWIFALFALALIFIVAYHELITKQLYGTGSVAGILVGVAIGILLIVGMLTKSKTARWIILLVAYITLLNPFITYIMLDLFASTINKSFWEAFIIPNIIISILLIALLSNKTALRLYYLKKSKKSRIKEQIYLFALAIILNMLYIYYIYIPLLYKTIY